MANISNTSRNTVLAGSSSADSIYNNATDMTINAGAGNDTVKTYGNNVSVNGGAGNDSIKSTGGANVTLHGGTGNDTLTGSSDAEVFQFRSDGGNDIITNFDSNDTLHIAEGALDSYYVDGDDLIFRAKNTSYSGTIRLRGAANSEVKVKVGSGSVQMLNVVNDILSRTPNKSVDGTSERDYIVNVADRVGINGAAGNDTVVSVGDYVSLKGGNGNDSIRAVMGRGVTLNGGAGDDTITGSYDYSSVFQFGSSDGNDVITNFRSYDTINIVSGTLSSYAIDRNDFVITVTGASETGTIRLKDYGDGAVRIKHAGGAESAINSYNYVYAYRNNTLVSGTSGNDYMHCNGYSSLKMSAGGGNDKIYAYTSRNSLNGGAGNDSVYSSGSYVTIKGGAGQDTVNVTSGNLNVIQFASNEGNDLIRGFNSTDTLHITAGSYSTYSVVGNDVVVSVKGSSYSGLVTLEGAGWTPIRIRSSSGTMRTINSVNTIENYNSNTLVSGTSGKDSIYNGGSYVTINAGGGNDRIYNNSNHTSIHGGAGNDSIGGYAYYSTLRGGAGNDTISAYSSYKTYQFGSSDGHDVITSFDEYDTLRLTAGSIASHYQSGDDYVVSVKGAQYSGSVTFKYVGLTPIRIRNTNGSVSIPNYDISNLKSSKQVNGTSSADKIFNEGSNVTINAGAGDDTVYTNYASNVTINAGADNDSIIGDYYYSTLKGGTGNDTITAWGNDNVYQFGAGDGNDVIQNFYGVEDTLHITDGTISSYDKFSYAYEYEENGYVYGAEIIGYVVNVENGSESGSISLGGVNDGDPIIVRGADNKMSVLGYDIFNLSSNKKVSGTKNADRIFNKGNYSTINAGAGNDVIFDQSYYSTINGGAGNDVIFDQSYYSTINGGAGADSIRARYYSTIDAGTGNDTIYNYDSYNSINGGAGNDLIDGNLWYATVRGGAGNDTIDGYNYYKLIQFGASDGNDLITNFYSSYDTIQITDGTISSHYKSGSNYVIKVGDSAAVTLQGAGSSSIKVQLESGLSAVLRNGTLTADTIDNSADNTLISGSSRSDSIRNSGDNVTIQGNAGNDTIDNTGSNIVYKFSSAHGYNLIKGFSSNDMINVTAGGLGSYYASGDDYVIELRGTNYSGAVTLEGAANSPIQVLTASGNLLTLNYSASRELPAAPIEDYWFERVDDPTDALDELEQIMSSENAVGLEFDPNDQFKAASIDLVDASARSHQKK